MLRLPAWHATALPEYQELFAAALNLADVAQLIDNEEYQLAAEGLVEMAEAMYEEALLYGYIEKRPNVGAAPHDVNGP